MINPKKLNPERIKEARLYRKLTMEDVADKIGLKKQAISQFENSKASPDPITLKKLADAVDFPYGFFFEKIDNSLIGNTYFRALYSSNKKDQVAQRIKTKYLATIFHILANLDGLSFKAFNIPNITAECGIEEMALIARQHWDLGQEPIPNMVTLLERNGMVVGEFSTDAREIDAFYQYCEIEGRPIYCVVLGTDKKSFYRRQFNCAHELGHILLHERFEDFNEISREDYRIREDQANAFAAALLLPGEAFAKDVSVYPNRLSHYIELKKKWKVSAMAMIMRAKNLAILSDNQYTYLMRQMSIKGYRTQEPLDSETPYKHPQALKQAIDGLIAKRHMSESQIVGLFSKSSFSIPANVLVELLNLEDKVLSQNPPDNNIIPFPVDRILK